MRNPSQLVALVVVGALGAMACSKDKPAPPAKPVEKVAAPADLAVVATLPSLDGGLGGVAAFVDGVQPGMGRMVTGQAETALPTVVGAAGLDGVDRGKPVRLVLLDPPAGQGVSGAVLVVGVKDAKALEKAAGSGVRVQASGGFAVVGYSALVERAAPWALGTLVAEAAPKEPMVVAYPAAILAAHRTDLENARSQLAAAMAMQQGGAGAADLGQVAGMYIDGVIATLEASERIELRVEGSAAEIGLDLALVPKPGSKLAGFVAAQKPSRYALLGRLPQGDASLFMAGHLELGPMRAELMPFIEKLMSSMFMIQLDEPTRQAMNVLLDEFSGEMAMAGHVGEGMAMDLVYGIADAGKTDAALRTMASTMIGKDGRTVELMGMKMTISGSLDAGSHDGVKFIRYKNALDLASLPPMQAELQKRMYGDGLESYVGAWDDVFGMAMGPGAAGRAERLVAASRGKGQTLALPPGIAAIVEASRGRGESLIYVFDIASLMQGMLGGAPAGPADSGMIMALGFQGGSAHVRLAMPGEHAKRLMTIVAGMQGR